jgi:hypothetical protein
MNALTPTKLLIIVVIILIFLIYAQYYSKFAKGYNITQTYLDKVGLDLLYERNPVVIYDSIKTPKQLLKTLFKYSYISKNEYVIRNQNIHLSKSKFSFVYHTGKNIDKIVVNLINPIYKQDFKAWRKSENSALFTTTPLEDTTVEYVSIKLKPFQVLIVPTHWMLQVVGNEDLVKVDLDDIFSYIYFKFV